MNCYYCKGVNTIEEQAVRLCECETGQPYIVENVPAFVCRLCGDKSFSGETLNTLEKIDNGEVWASGVQVVQVFNFHQLDKRAKYTDGRSGYFAIEVESTKGNPVVANKNSYPWLSTVVQQIERRILNDQPYAEYAYFRPDKASQSHPFSSFSNIDYTEPVIPACQYVDRPKLPISAIYANPTRGQA